MKPFNGAAQCIFDGIRKHRKNAFTNPQVKMDLERLYPGKDREEIYRDFYVGKLEKSMTIIVAGILLAGLLSVKAGAGRRLDGENVFLRGSPSVDVEEINVETVIDGNREKFVIPLWTRQLTEGEAEALYRDFREELPRLILGKNPSLQEVKQDLELLECYDGYPFWVEWKSTDRKSVSSAGVVNVQEERKEVVLEAEILYGEMTWEEKIAVSVCAQEYSEEELRHREMEERLILEEENSRGDPYFTLPDTWNGESLEWSRAVDDYSMLVGAGTILIGIAIYFLKDKDLHTELEKRRAQMKREYPDIVHKLTLYLGAGMTLRGAFQKIADEYSQGRERGNPEGPAYEEMIVACREMKSGISEGEVYERFGKRTGLQDYIRLCTLLAQNLKKGNNALMQRLKEEADRACVERIQNSRRLGEEASTKLLVPMVMMLGVVMVMVMLPAFSSMGM